MKEKTDKLITWIGLGVALLATVLSILFAMSNGDVKVLEAVRNGGLFDATYWILIILIAISLIAIVWFLVVKLAHNFKENPGYIKKFLLMLGLIIVACLAAFLLSRGNDVSPALMEKNNITEGTSKLIGAACILVYILVIAAACSIIYVECSKAFKKK
jgi:magnesium-transporting ATPase (P-type)